MKASVKIVKGKVVAVAGRPLRGALDAATEKHIEAITSGIVVSCDPMKCDIREFPPQCRKLDCTLTTDCSDFEVPCDKVEIKAPAGG